MIFNFKIQFILLILFLEYINTCPNYILSFKSHNDYVTTLAKLSDGNVATGSLDETILVWNPYTGDILRNLSTKSVVQTLAELDNGHLASGLNGYIKIWDLNSGNLIRTLKENEANDSVIFLYKLEDGNLLSATGHKQIKIWNPVTGALVRIINEIENAVQVFLLKNNYIATVIKSDSVYKINIWNPSNGELVKKFSNHSDVINQVLYLDKAFIASASNDQTIKIWDFYTENLVYNLDSHSDQVTQLIELNNGEIASGSKDKQITIWNYLKGEQTRTLVGPASINDLVLLSYRYLASSFDDSTLIIWNQNGDIVRKESINLNRLYSLKDFYLIGTTVEFKNYTVFVLDYSEQNCLISPPFQPSFFDYLLQRFILLFWSFLQKIQSLIY